MEITEIQASFAPAAAEKPGVENWPVIVAEGDKGRRAAMLAWLKDWAYTAMPAVNSEHALELLRQPGGSTLALVGQKLRGFDGPELCRKINRRRSLRTSSIRPRQKRISVTSPPRSRPSHVRTRFPP